MLVLARGRVSQKLEALGRLDWAEWDHDGSLLVGVAELARVNGDEVGVHAPVLAHDVRVRFDVGHGGDLVHEHREILRPADLREALRECELDVGEGADRRTRKVLAANGYPVDHRVAQIGADHLAADMVIALGRNHFRFLREAGVDDHRVRMLRAFDPRTGAHTPDVDDPYYGGDAEFEEVFDVIAAALPGLHAWVDEQLDGS